MAFDDKDIKLSYFVAQVVGVCFKRIVAFEKILIADISKIHFNYL